MAPMSIGNYNYNIKHKLNPKRAFKALYSRKAPAIYLEMPVRGLLLNLNRSVPPILF